ncbi:MAG TPA: helix-turn-helix domain-containing protein [Propionibacteriaceae bacterium]|nr:helix-turn-helix domain-containing protein [Propionibacteriaceae bacterium]
MTTLWSCPKPDCPPTDTAPRETTPQGVEADLSTEEVADLLYVPVETVHKWRTEGVGPSAYRIGNRLRYRKSEVLQWSMDQAEGWAVCSSECGRVYMRGAFSQIDG